MTNDRRKRAERAEQMRLERERADKRQRTLITLGIVVVVALLIGAGAWAVKSGGGKDSKDLSTTYVAPKGAGDDYSVTYDTKAATGTAATDPVTVVIYEDFQCPFCKVLEDKVGDFLDQGVASGELTIQWHPLAVLDRASSTEYSSRSLNAALCVLDTTGVKAFAAIHQALYAHQPAENSSGLGDAKLADLAAKAGAGDIGSCLSTRMFGPWMTKANAKASADGIDATPTVEVAGKKVEGAGGGVPKLADLEKAIAAAK